MRRALALVALSVCLSACGVGPIGAWKPAAQPPALINPGMITLPLPGDRVGVFGGIVTSTGQPIAQTLIYDSTTDRWAQGAPIPEARYSETTAVLKDGEILFAGGSGEGAQGLPKILTSTYIYDPVHDAWRRAGDLNTARVTAQAVALDDGKVLITGGSGDTTSEVFDPASGRWSRAGSTNDSRSGAVVAALPGGRALAAGGCSGGQFFGQTPTSIGSAEIFEESAGAWRPTSPMPEARCTAAGFSLADGRVLVIGGFSVFGKPSQNAVLFDPKSASWSPAGTTAASGAAFNGQPLQAVILSDHRVFIPAAEAMPRTGTYRLTTLIIGGQLYDPASGTWSYVASTDRTTDPRFGVPQVLGAAPLSGSRVVILLANVVAVLSADEAPPPTAALDSLSLTFVLLALTGVLLIAIAAVYVFGRRQA